MGPESLYLCQSPCIPRCLTIASVVVRLSDGAIRNLCRRHVADPRQDWAASVPAVKEAAGAGAAALEKSTG